MAQKNILMQGMGFFAGSTKWIVTAGFASRAAIIDPGSGNIKGEKSHLGIPAGQDSDLILLSGTGESELKFSRGSNSDLN